MKKLLALLFAVTFTFGCAKKEVPVPVEPPVAPKTVTAPPPISPEEAMKKMTEAATPGEEHKRLQGIVGNWKTTSNFWMEPGKKPEVSKGTAKHEWILGKRFVREEYRGKFAGQKFVGNGIVGYDNVKKQYVSTWIDSMGTGVMLAEGSYNAAANQIEMGSHYSCPMTGGERSGRTVTRFVSKNEFVFEMFDKTPDGVEVKVMEIVYKRAS